MKRAKRATSIIVIAGLLTIAVVAGAATPPDSTDSPNSASGLRVYVVAIDSLRPDEVSENLTPTLHQLRPKSTWYESVSVLPSSSTQNYAAMFTGVPPQDNGFVHNVGGQLFEADHLFTRLYNERPEVSTFFFTNSPGIDALFAQNEDEDEDDGQVAPEGGFDPDPFGRFQAEAMKPGPQFGFLHLTEPDSVAHALPTPEPGEGPLGAARAEREAAIRAIDLRLGMFIDTLKQAGAWSQTVLFVVSDHGMAFVNPATGWINFDRDLILAGYDPPDSGEGNRDYNVLGAPDGSAFIDATEDENIEPIANVLCGLDGVTLIATKRSGPSLGESEKWRENCSNVATGRLAELGLEHELAGDLVMFADKDHTFIPTFFGMHGHPITQPTVLMVAGGHPRLTDAAGQQIVGFETPTESEPADPVGRPSVLSIAPTVSWLFNLPRAFRSAASGQITHYANGRLEEAFRPQ